MQKSDPLTTHFRIDVKAQSALKRLGIVTIKDMLYHFPARYSSIAELHFINELSVGEQATILGTITKANTKKSFRTKVPIAEVTLEDQTGTISIVWFHQAYLAKMFRVGDSVKVTGRVTETKQGLTLANPEIEKTPTLAIDMHHTLFANDSASHKSISFPIYPESRGVTSKFIYHTIQKILKSDLLESLIDPIPEFILKKYSLPKLQTALVWIHAPQNENHALAARKRFAFEEVFFIQLVKQRERNKFKHERSYTINIPEATITDFTKRFPFALTEGQERAIKGITADLVKGHPMSRLLEGDVGSGKTAIAATAAYGIVTNRPALQTFGNLQVAYMAPTEILATQLFENFISYFRHTGIQIGLMTGSGCRKFPSKVASATTTWTNISRAQLLKWVVNGEIPILIGTHALIQKSVIFKHLALVIIDEQHRFGTMQRSSLVHKDSKLGTVVPHLLSMTATPIPRTLALTIYGDLDLTLLDQMPHGRKPIITKIIASAKRDEAYTEIEKELVKGRQVYIICPRINEPDPTKELALQAKSVTEEAKRLKLKVFPKYTIGILHSKMTKQKKEKVMDDFSKHAIDILCATSVVEVGVNVLNATVIVIEGAERFGLAQLHQLRGRVIRSNEQAYCYLFAEAKSEKTRDRLQALVTAKNGFELSELDLTLRGAGELGGGRQWGITDIGMEAIKNIKMVEAARSEAYELVETGSLINYPALESTLGERKASEIHFE
jgi:ATP-dependent DNA helicase RecG